MNRLLDYLCYLSDTFALNNITDMLSLIAKQVIETLHNKDFEDCFSTFSKEEPRMYALYRYIIFFLI